MKNFKYIFILILLQIIPAFAQNYINIPDSTLPRTGLVYSLPVYSNIDLHNASSVKIKIYFNYYLIDIKNISGGSNNAFSDANPSFALDVTNPTQAVLEITSSQINPNYSGTLCSINLETLAGPDSIAVFIPFYIEINQLQISEVTFDNGTIRIGDPVYPVLNEGISHIYPNPYSFAENVVFTIEDSTTVDFYIYSTLGQLATRIPGSNILKYKFFDNAGQEIPSTNNYKFSRGIYRLYFESIPWKFSSSAYSIVMVTNKGIFRSNFIHLK